MELFNKKQYELIAENSDLKEEIRRLTAQLSNCQHNSKCQLLRRAESKKLQGV